ncbi:hypothetical protein GDO81_008728 [Engystomops pustulosus]|uniref:Uncharacterized protein n=1 Tax=Engystomops pustulosus TaxID=76066 RepID=A0AAV7CHR0_ENGPU|nr:hypothetical protein GDO81_008728 [Engystomops pustulosus]
MRVSYYQVPKTKPSGRPCGPIVPKTYSRQTSNRSVYKIPILNNVLDSPEWKTMLLHKGLWDSGLQYCAIYRDMIMVPLHVNN